MPETAQIKLWFTCANAPELQKVSFCHPLLKEDALSIRGKTSGAFSPLPGTKPKEVSVGWGSFQWSQAVQALCILLLRTAACTGAGENTKPLPQLSGVRGSPAASLDFALGKPPVWLQDMFGLTNKGEALGKRLFCRTNPELKYPGPVILSLNTRQISPEHIYVYWDELPITSDLDLEDLARAIELNWQLRGTRSQKISSITEHSSPKDSLGKLKSIFREEALFMLRSTDIFNLRNQEKSLNRIYAQPEFNRICPGKPSLISDIDRQLSASARLGLGVEEAEFKKHLAGETPIRVATACGQLGCGLLFEYLRQVKGYNIEIDHRYAYAIEIMRKMVAHSFINPPDLCALGIAPAGTLLGAKRKNEYQPLMLIPGMRHRVLASAGSSTKSADISRGEYYFLHSDPSTSFFYFEDLENSGQVNKNKVKYEHAEPYEITWALRDGDSDVRAIMFFPYYNLNVLYNNCRCLDQPKGEENVKDFVLFAHDSLMSNPEKARCLDIAIRDAWLELRRGGPVIDRLISYLLSNPVYLKFVKRVSGMEDFLFSFAD